MFSIEELLLRLRQSVKNSYNIVPEGLVLEQPKDPSHGCLSTNTAMLLAKPLKRSPRELATEIVRMLGTWDEVESAEVAGPGFVNLRMKPHYWQTFVSRVLLARDDYGRSVSRNRKVNVEYVSANPTGPLHVANARGAVVGDVIANLFTWNGYDVTKEYYVNDAGEQIKILARSTFLRYKEALGQEITIPEGYYPGEYLKDVAETLKQQHGDSLLAKTEVEALRIIESTACAAMLQLIKNDLAELGVFQEYKLESEMLRDSDSSLENLKSQGLVYEGFLPPPKGIDASNWVAKKLTIFAATNFGDDVDRPLTKDDNQTPTYFGNDLFYHANKIARGYNRLINILGADHSGYVKRLKAVVAALSDHKVSYDMPICQMVRLTKSGKPYVMSKRSGSFVRLSDLVSMCGADAVRFFMLMRKQDAPLDFDIDLVVNQTSENPVFYVQYAHARCASVLRHARDLFSPESLSSLNLAKADFDSLTHEAEKQLLRKIASFPRVVNLSCEQLEPHKIAFFARELAASFHSLWNIGSGDNTLRFLNAKNLEESLARTALVAATKQTLRNAMLIIGIEPLENL